MGAQWEMLGNDLHGGSSGVGNPFTFLDVRKPHARLACMSLTRLLLLETLAFPLAVGDCSAFILAQKDGLVRRALALCDTHFVADGVGVPASC